MASITCSLIIVRSEDALDKPLTLPSSVGTSGSSADIEKRPKNQDGKVFAFGPMTAKVNVNTSETVDEDV